MVGRASGIRCRQTRDGGGDAYSAPSAKVQESPATVQMADRVAQRRRFLHFARHHRVRFIHRTHRTSVLKVNNVQ